jgi:hypothetical protein
VNIKTVELTDDKFGGYIFRGAPPRRPRLWFLDRDLYPLTIWGSQIIWQPDGTELTVRSRYGAGVDHIELKERAAELDLDAGIWSMHIPWHTGVIDYPSETPLEVLRLAMPGMTMRYEHWGAQRWAAAWKLTDLTVPHVVTFGKEDTWRLGIWPD